MARPDAVSGDYTAAFEGFRFQMQFAGLAFEGLLIGVGFLFAMTLGHWRRWLGNTPTYVTPAHGARPPGTVISNEIEAVRPTALPSS